MKQIDMDISKIPYLKKLEELGLGKSEFIIWGSSPLVIRGIKEGTEDLDILVKKPAWDRLLVYYNIVSRKVSALRNEFIVIDNIDITYKVVGIWEEFTEELFARADKIDDYNVLSLEDTIKWKSKTGREKDLQDIEKINLYQK